MDEILESIKPVVKNAKSVWIDRDAIVSFTKTVSKEEFENSEINLTAAKRNNFTEEEQIAYAFVLSALQFCFWGEPKWTISCNGEKLDGSAALVCALQRGLDNGHKLLNADYLSDLSADDLDDILRGEPQIPLFEERLRLLRILGQTIRERFRGSFGDVIKQCDGDAVSIVRCLVKDFAPIFDDSADYHGHTVHLHKRAQLVPIYLFDMYQKKLLKQKITGKERLTGLADYKVPQMLRSFGIIGYEASLADRIDHKIEIPAGSDEEIEIRALTVESGDLAKEILKDKFPEISGALIHKILWHRSQQKSPTIKPYHRTRTIWY